MDSQRKRQKKLSFSNIEVTPVYRPLKFPLHREVVGDSDDEFDLSRASSSSKTTLPVPASLGRRNLSRCWWMNCPRKCRAYKPDFIDYACDACFRIRGVREDGRTALSLRMVEIDSRGGIRVVARHSKTIKIVDKNGVRAKSLFDGEGNRRVVYLNVRDRRGPHEPTHTMVFAIRYMDLEESRGAREIELESNGGVVSCRRSFDSSHGWNRHLPREESPITPTGVVETSDRAPITFSPTPVRHSKVHGCVHASSTSDVQAFSNEESMGKVVSPSRGDVCIDKSIGTSHRASQRQHAAFATPETRPYKCTDHSTGWRGPFPGSHSRDEGMQGNLKRTGCDVLPLRRRLAFEPEDLSDKQPASLCKAVHQSLPEPVGDLVTQVERLLTPRSTQGSTQSAVLMLPREDLLTLSMQDATQTGLSLSPKSLREVTHCRSLTFRGWVGERNAAAPISFRRAVIDLIVREDAPEKEASPWLPSLLDCDCVLSPSSAAHLC